MTNGPINIALARRRERAGRQMAATLYALLSERNSYQTTRLRRPINRRWSLRIMRALNRAHDARLI